MVGKTNISIIFFIFFALLGIGSTFMPWIYYPKADMSFYGYKADGVVTGFIFFLLLLFGIYILSKKRLPILSTCLFAAMSLWLAYISYSKYARMEDEKINFKSPNPLLSAASAGAEQGIGIYVLGIAGLGAFLSILAAFFFQNTSKTNKINSNVSKQWMYIIPITILLIAGYFIKQHRDASSYNKTTLWPVLSVEVEKMGHALASGDYNTFADYNHQIMLQSMGGKEKVIDLARATIDGMKEKGATIHDVSLSEIVDFASKGTNLQVLLKQQITFNIEGKDDKEIQTMIAVSDDSGATWKFINISGKSKAEMIKFFPSLNQKLNF